MSIVKYRATQISDAFAIRGIEEGNCVTQMMLQKMVFFAHGLHLAYTKGSPLVYDTFEAWKFGPVVPEIYHKYKLYGSAPIDNLNPLSGYNVEVVPFDERALEVINTTWDTLKGLDPIQVSNWTHREGSAWSKVYQPNKAHIVIPNQLIMQDFTDFIDEETGN